MYELTPIMPPPRRSRRPAPETTIPAVVVLGADPIESSTAAEAATAMEVRHVGSAAEVTRVLADQSTRPVVVAVALENEATTPARLELIRRLGRAREPVGTVVIIDPANVALLLEAVRAGADDVALRPVTVTALRESLERALSRRAARLTARSRLRALEESCARLQELAVHDPLTGLYNRRHFDARLAAELRRSARSGQPIALVVVDLDGFKGLNDVRGHEAGDVHLVRVAQVLGARCRASDIASRIGGDELAVILPDTDETGARAVAEGLRAGLAIDLDATTTDRARRLTASVGVAACPPIRRQAAPLFAAADAALYRVKSEGGDGVRLATTTSPETREGTTP